MSIASEITRISGNIADAYTACNDKGATMPTAENQNSANLADTINSIPAGGGETEDRNYVKDYNKMVEVLNGVLDGGYTAQKALNQGWTIYDSNISNHQFGVVLDEETESIYIRTYPTYQGWVAGVKIPSGASITDVSTDIKRIDFDKEKWVCFCTGNLAIDQFRRCTNIEGANWTQNYNIAKILCIYMPTIASNSSLSTIFNLASMPFIKIIKLSDNFSISALTLNDVTVLRCITQLDNREDICKLISGYNSTDGYLLPCTKSSIKGYAFGLKQIILKKCPITFDFSSDTGTGTLNICVFNGYSSDMNIIDYDFKIKLPSNYSTVELFNYNYSIPFSKESLEYMADKAPTVNGATLALGVYLDKWLTVTADGQVIRATLESKGWTVTA